MDFKQWKQWTIEELAEHQSPEGTWTREALASVGVQFPPVKGWMQRLLAGADPNSEAQLDAVFVRLHDGTWGLKLPCATREIHRGLPVNVRRKDGSTSSVRVASIVKQGSNYALATFY